MQGRNGQCHMYNVAAVSIYIAFSRIKRLMYTSGWSGGNIGPRPLGPRRNRWAACASRRSF